MYPIDKIYYKSENGFLWENGRVIDPFYPDKSYVSKTNPDKYFRKWYGITYQEAYNIVSGLPKDYRKICENDGCTNEVKWFGYKGYGRFCCRQCQNEYLSRTEEAREAHRLHFRTMNQEKNNAPDFQAWSHYQGFMSRGDRHDITWVYFTKFEQYYKFGVTQVLERRKGDLNLGKILEAERWEVSAIEYFMARINCSEWSLDYKKLFNLYYIVREFMQNRVTSSTTIEDLVELTPKLVEYIQANGSAKYVEIHKDIVSTFTEMWRSNEIAGEN